MKSENLSFIFNPEECIQCHACELACRSWRFSGTTCSNRKVMNFWEGSFPDTSCRTVVISCLHCSDPACIKACPVGALQKKENGVVALDEEKCIACRACLKACPYDVPQFNDKLMHKCDMCTGQDFHPPCVSTCPTGALKIAALSDDEKAVEESKIFDLLAENG